MNQEQVHEQLTALHNCKEPFTVVFSGKKNRRVNGTYRAFTAEITIHNRNFISDDGELQESLLMYTAMHELAHHIQFTEHGQIGHRSHTNLFRAILDDLADKAEKQGIYSPKIFFPKNPELESVIIEAQLLTQQIAQLQRELGAVMRKLQKVCFQSGVRYEDVVQRAVGISMNTAKKVSRIQALDLPKNISADKQETIAAERDADKRRVMVIAAQAGKSVAQVKQAGSASHSGKGETETENLLREKERLEKTIAELQRRLRKIMEQLNTDSGLRSQCAAEVRIC